MTFGVWDSDSNAGRNARRSNLRFSERAIREWNDGHIFGERMRGDCCAGCSDSSGFRAPPVHDFNLPATRFSVDKSSRGGRVPMVFTQMISRCPSHLPIRCWQLDGWRPQSSANTTRGRAAVGVINSLWNRIAQTETVHAHKVFVPVIVSHVGAMRPSRGTRLGRFALAT